MRSTGGHRTRVSSWSGGVLPLDDGRPSSDFSDSGTTISLFQVGPWSAPLSEKSVEDGPFQDQLRGFAPSPLQLTTTSTTCLLQDTRGVSFATWTPHQPPLSCEATRLRYVAASRHAGFSGWPLHVSSGFEPQADVAFCIDGEARPGPPSSSLSTGALVALSYRRPETVRAPRPVVFVLRGTWRSSLPSRCQPTRMHQGPQQQPLSGEIPRRTRASSAIVPPGSLEV
jgi:hypothetical protein